MGLYGARLPILVQSEVGAEINPLDLLVGGQTIWCAAPENHAVVHNVRAISNPEGFPDIVIGDEYSDAPRFEVKDDLLNVRHRDRIDSRERLVEQHEERRNHE